MIEDDEPVSAVGKELRIDDDKTGVGVTALIGAAALVPLLAFGVEQLGEIVAAVEGAAPAATVVPLSDA